MASRGSRPRKGHKVGPRTRKLDYMAILGFLRSVEHWVQVQKGWDREDKAACLESLEEADALIDFYGDD